MARVVERTVMAQRDLAEIWHFIAMDNVRAADRLIKKLVSECQTLAKLPTLGRPRPQFGPEVRGTTVGRYILFYRETSKGIELLRVIHGARDIQSLDDL